MDTNPEECLAVQQTATGRGRSIDIAALEEKS